MKTNLHHYYQLHKKWFYALLAVTVLTAAVILLLAIAASHAAAFIFNKEMAKQTMLRGTVTVNTISADITGEVEFTDLLWTDSEGRTIATVPTGSFRVNPWDIISHSIKSTTLREVTLNDAVFAVYFDNDMHLDVIASETAKQDRQESKTWEDRIRNLNWNGNKIKLTMTLNNCRLESYHRNQHYILLALNTTLHLDTDKRLDLDISAGPFGGTAVGDGAAIKGVIDLQSQIPILNLSISLLGIDPSSLGFGSAIHNKMTLTFRANGPITAPYATGHLRMDKLELPALSFTDVKGNVVYHNSRLDFSDVTANVYTGKLQAYGDYNIETRAYHIYGNGTGLDSRPALKTMQFYCLVDLDIAMECDGDPRHLTTFGSFHSGKGYYFPIHFNYLKGRFSNRDKTLDFYDVIISTHVGDVKTDALHIIDGNVQIGTVELFFPGGTSLTLTAEPDYAENITAIQENIDTTKNNIDNLKNYTTQTAPVYQSLSKNLANIKESWKSMENSLDNLTKAANT